MEQDKLEILYEQGKYHEYIKEKIDNIRVFDLGLVTATYPELNSDINANYKAIELNNETVVVDQQKSVNETRRLFIMRHAERVDLSFGKRWVESSFNANGKYVRKDLNMPSTLPLPRSKAAWINDTPITNMGYHHAYLTGCGMREAGAKISYLYSSPALRSVQTSDAFLKGYQGPSTLKIRIEPAFYQLPAFEGVPEWVTPANLRAAGYNIDMDYCPTLSRDNLMEWEQKFGIKEQYERNYKQVLKVLQETGNGNVFICGHGDSPETCSRQLIGSTVEITATHLHRVAITVPFCSLVTLELNSKSNRWQMVESPIPPLTSASFKRFDWQNLQMS